MVAFHRTDCVQHNGTININININTNGNGNGNGNGGFRRARRAAVGAGGR